MLSWYLIKAEKNKEDSRCRKWRIVVRKKDGGTRSETFLGTKTDATKRAPIFALEVEDESELSSSSLVDICRPWLDLRVAMGEITDATRKGYEVAFNAYGDVSFVPVSEVTTKTFDKITRELVSGLNRWTVQNYASKIRTCLTHCVEIGALKRNPAEKATIPRGRQKSAGKVAPDISVAAILDLPPDNRYEFAVSLILRTGMRRKEALGVTWGDYDGESLHITRQVTKTDAGTRRIPLDASSAAFIESRRAFLAEINGDVPPNAPLCCTDELAPLSSSMLEEWWRKNRDYLGCHGLRLHDLRHTYLTNLAQAGVHPAVMQRLAGHASAQMTMELYTHVQDVDTVDAVEQLAAMRNAKQNAKRGKSSAQNA